MSAPRHLLAIDQGTTSTRTVLFDDKGQPIFTAQTEFTQIFPQDGWVEHDPEEIWQTVLDTCKQAIAASKEMGGTIAGLGITNQRETSLIWDKKTGKTVYNAIVWQDRRTSETCHSLRDQGHEAMVTEKTGLLLDPYFSGSKIAWILDNQPELRARADNDELAFGTIDSFLLWRLTGGKVHATDATNASRTMIYNIHNNQWDDELLALLNVPASLLPEVLDCASDFGQTDPELFGESIKIAGIAGDQHAAAIGQACFEPGMIKSTYGTGCFVLVNTGDKAISSEHRLLTTIAYRLNGETTYAIEGSIFSAGAAIQWLRDGLGIIKSASDSEAIASGLDGNHGVYLVPAFTGLGSPHWNAEARGSIYGLTRDSGPAEIVRATLESVCYQTNDLFKAMNEDGVKPSILRVDGGMVKNDWLVQQLSDTVDIQVQRPVVTETTALGAAFLAGLQTGVFASLDDLASYWRCEADFEPNMPAQERDTLIAGWDKAIARTLL
ncbi:glycerol kinase GlpK [Leucothrix pacifica]|uniref:Glycerol kinase n=1 Tax=Leucothrix pacifica TaxID=1247513 RepID=A0A317CDD9_9GAMM|nr:glycerol kinase GlpK [Leucothrix pacifica]PWQ96654.1 glycerol kinase [Leucothrix pacifica]